MSVSQRGGNVLLKRAAVVLRAGAGALCSCCGQGGSVCGAGCCAIVTVPQMPHSTGTVLLMWSQIGVHVICPGFHEISFPSSAAPDSINPHGWAVLDTTPSEVSGLKPDR